VKAQLDFSGHHAEPASGPLDHGRGPDLAHDVVSLFLISVSVI
jgi:hypothetical protein